MFEITDTGRQQLAERGEQPPPWEFQDDPSFRAAGELRRMVAQTGIAAMQVAEAGSEEQIGRAQGDARGGQTSALQDPRRGRRGLIA